MIMDYKTKTFSFGKRDYNHTGRRINKVTITVRLDKDDDGRLRFAASGEIWNAKQTDCLEAGQIIDNIGEYFPSLKNNPTYMELLYTWEHCHLKYLDVCEPFYVEKINSFFD